MDLCGLVPFEKRDNGSMNEMLCHQLNAISFFIFRRCDIGQKGLFENRFITFVSMNTVFFIGKIIL